MTKLSNTSDTILACARTLIANGGYNGFSYADIARQVGIRKPSIHHHFPAKADLVTTLVSRHREATQHGIAAMEQHIAEPLARLQGYVDYWKTCIGDASSPFCVCALLASELPILPAEVAQEVLGYFRFLSSWLTGLLGSGAERGVIALTQPARVEAEAFMATVHGAMLSARVYSEPAIFGTIMDAQLARLVA